MQARRDPSREVAVTLQRGATSVILKGVPAEVCENCGEYYLSAEVVGQVAERAEAAVASGGEVEILRYAAWIGLSLSALSFRQRSPDCRRIAPPQETDPCRPQHL